MRRIDADALKKTLGDWIIAHYTDTFTGDDAGLQFAYLINRTETIDKVEKEMNFDEKEEQNMASNIIGERIAGLLREQGKTQRELAEQVGTTEVSMYRYIKGDRVPKGPILANIAKALHTTTDYLLGNEKDSNDPELEITKPMESKWISCTKRLPEKSGRYLVTRGSNVCGSLWDKLDILNYSDLMGLKKEKIWWSGNVGKSDFEKFNDVIAWQPLPEPYKTGIRINFSKFSNFGLLDALREEFGFGDVKRSDCFGCEDETTEDDSTVPAHWIDKGHKIFKCSNCGNYLDFRGVNAGRGTANYCPNCGAKMWNILTRKPQNKNSQREKKK